MRKLILLATALLALLAATPARAGVALAADAKLGVPIGSFSEMLNIGYGIDGRLGYSLGLAVIDIQPEIVGGYMRFGSDTTENHALWRFMVGGRAAIGAGLQVFGYVHTGYGGYKAGSLLDTQTGVAYDLGLGLDFTALPLLTVGVSGGYNQVRLDGGEVNWIDLGIHAQLAF